MTDRDHIGGLAPWGSFIIKLGDKYLEWSTIVDAPVTDGMTRDELEAYMTAEYGRSGMDKFEDRMKRVEEKGTSAYDYASVDEVLIANRAGDDEQELTKQQIIEKYCQGSEA